MIKWNDTLFYDNGLKSKLKRKRILKRVNGGKLTFPGDTGIFLAESEENIAEIIVFNELLQPYFKNKELICIGMASSREAAEELLTDVLTLIYHEHGHIPVAEVRKYLLK